MKTLIVTDRTQQWPFEIPDRPAAGAFPRQARAITH